MKIRSTYFKVTDMQAAVAFWRALLDGSPVKESPRWSEFLLGDVRLGLLLNDFETGIQGCSSVPVFEVEPQHLPAVLARAKAAGASVLLDGLADPKMNSIVLASPSGDEFELCQCPAVAALLS